MFRLVDRVKKKGKSPVYFFRSVMINREALKKLNWLRNVFLLK